MTDADADKKRIATQHWNPATDGVSDEFDAADLTRFQLEALYGLADIGPTYGLDLKDRLEDLYGHIHHGQLYPNLQEMADAGLVEKRKLDGRTKEYELTSSGKELLRRDLQRRQIAAEGMGGEA